MLFYLKLECNEVDKHLLVCVVGVVCIKVMCSSLCVPGVVRSELEFHVGDEGLC